MSRLLLHWPEYLIEAISLGLFLVSAATFATLLQHPDSPLATLGMPPLALRTLMGIAMGGTAVALIYSPLGKRSGAHLNPAVTLAFVRVGQIAPADAAGYVVAQFAGGWLGIAAATLLLGGRPADPSVNYVATVPGPWGAAAAFLAEAAMSFAMMTVVLTFSNVPRLSRFTGLTAGLLIAVWIAVESPVSGMSLNPARTLGSNWLAGAMEPVWIYFAAPIAGMLLAAEVHVRRPCAPLVRCAKLHHTFDVRCIFRCGHVPAPTELV